MKKIASMIIVLAVALGTAACKQQEQKNPVTYAPAAPSPLAIEQLQNAARIAPKNPRSWTELGDGLMDSQRYNEAIEAYQKALALDPKNVDVRVDLGTCYRGTKQFDKAVAEYRNALKINPNHPNGHRNLGVVLVNDLHKTEEGVKEFKKYLELAPNAPDAGQMRQTVQELSAGK
jgi:tetratricopeptide (TPR) repeat protein